MAPGRVTGTTRIGERLSTLPITISSGPGVLPAPGFAVGVATVLSILFAGYCLTQP